MHSLVQEDELGSSRVRIVTAEQVADAERTQQLPEMVVLGGQTLYNVIYSDSGVPMGSIRFTDRQHVHSWEQYIRSLFEIGEDIATYFAREIAPLPARPLTGAHHQRAQRCVRRSRQFAQRPVGNVSHDVVQSGSVTGGIHFHRHGGSGAGREGPVPRQLPGDIHRFVNRTAELGQLNAVLPGEDGEDGAPVVVSVCVVAGTAGAGKTSLAPHWAHQVRDRFPDGQLYVNRRGYDPGEPMRSRE